MSKINYSKGKFFLTDNGKTSMLLDVRTSAVNRSRIHSHQTTSKGEVIFPLENIVRPAAVKIFRKNSASLAELIIYLRVVARLLRKPQTHNVLHVGRWSPLDEALAQILPQFNPANKLYCLSDTRPLGKVSGVTFLCAEGGELPLTGNFFDTVIMSAGQVPSTQQILAVKDFGKIYFTAPKENVVGALDKLSEIFPLTDSLSLLEMTIYPNFRPELLLKTPQAEIAAKIDEIVEVVKTLQGVIKNFQTMPRKKRNAVLDEYFIELSRAEKILAEIYPELNSDTVKYNFNLLKESLIDLRLENGSLANIYRQYDILGQDFDRI